MEFYKQKDFGELISTPFIFFGKQFKPFITGLVIFVGPFILIESVLIGYFNFSPSNDLITQIQTIGTNKSLSSYFIKFFEFFKNIMLYTYIGGYVKLFVNSRGQKTEIQDVWKEICRFYWPVAGGQILGGIIIAVGFILLVIPGIYLAVALSPLFVVIIFEESGISKSITRSFELIKRNWWMIFALFIVLFIMLTTASGVLYLLTEIVSPFISQGAIFLTISNLSELSFEGIISVFLILLPVFLYGHLIGETEQLELRKKINEIYTDNPDTEENENLSETETKEEENRFLNDDTDRFKPKY